MKRERAMAVFLALALLLTLTAACGKKDTGKDSGGDTSASQGESTSLGNPANGFSQAEVSDQEKKQEPEEPVDENPQLEGVYVGENGFAVIRYVSDEMCDFIVSHGENGSEGYLAGVAQIRDGLVVYESERYALEMRVNFDTLTLTEDGTNPYSYAGFQGEYQRNGQDPRDVETKPSTLLGEIPDTLNPTVVNGEPAVLYIDPDNRFTVTLPDVFSDVTDDDSDGVLTLGSLDGDVSAEIDSTGAKVASSEELKAQLENSTGAQADLYVDGSVSLEYEETGNDGETYIVILLAHPLEGGSLLVSYRFQAAQEEYFRPLVDQISINIS